jgi:hypothetical protein
MPNSAFTPHATVLRKSTPLPAGESQSEVDSESLTVARTFSIAELVFETVGGTSMTASEESEHGRLQPRGCIGKRQDCHRMEVNGR